MTAGAFYNENDPFVAEWLRSLIAAGHLPLGRVDSRSITEIQPEDCNGASHFFAGIGGWPLALRLAGVSDSAPIWSGSCPCQPFSAVGKRRGTEDKRHLWPVFRNLIAECAPPVIFGEQVASPAGRAWLADVRNDLEDLGYAVGASDLCAPSVGAPQARQRLFWVAHANGAGLEGLAGDCPDGHESGRNHAEPFRSPPPESGAVHLARWKRCIFSSDCGPDGEGPCAGCGGDYGTCNCPGPTQDRIEHVDFSPVWLGRHEYADAWDEWAPVELTDGTRRLFQPGAFPMDHGIPARVVRARAYGNAIVPALAVQFILAALEAIVDDAWRDAAWR